MPAPPISMLTGMARSGKRKWVFFSRRYTLPRKNVNIEIGRAGPVRTWMRSCRWVFFSLAPDPDITHEGALQRGPDGKMCVTYRTIVLRRTPPALGCRSDGWWKMKIHDKPATDIMENGPPASTPARRPAGPLARRPAGPPARLPARRPKHIRKATIAQL